MKVIVSLFYGAVVTASCLLVVPVADAACISGGVVDNINDCVGVGKGSKDCLLAWSIDSDGLGNPPIDPKKGTPSGKVNCKDGDPCDADGYANGECVFHIGACVNAGPSCAAATLTNLRVKKPSTKDAANAVKKEGDFYTRRTVLAEVGGLLPETGEACTAADLEVLVRLKRKRGTCASPSGQKCSHDQDCDDYCVLRFKKNKTVIKARIDDGAKAKDSDGLKFTCLPADPGSGAPRAEARRIADAADLVGGPLAMGRLNDWLIRNGNIRVVVRDVGRLHAFAVNHGGHVIDADLARSDPAEDMDNFAGLQSLIQLASTQNTTDIVVLNDGADGNPAIIRTSGPDDLFDVLSPEMAIYQAGNTLTVGPEALDLDLPVNLTTDYILRPDTNYVQIATTVENLDSQDLRLRIGDFMNAGGASEAFGPGLGFGEAELRIGGEGSAGTPQGLDFMAWQGAGSGRGVTYGMVFPNSPRTVGIGKFQDGTFKTGAIVIDGGVAVWLHGLNLPGYLNSGFLQKPTSLFNVPAGGTNTLRRWFVVGETIADVTRAREELFGTKLGVIQGTVTSNGAPLANARVAFIRTPGNRCAFAGGNNCVNVFSATITDDQGFYRAFLKPADYNVAVRGEGVPYEGGASTPADHPVTLKSRKTEVVDVDLPATGAISVDVVDESGSPISAKVSIVGFEASPDPLNLDSIANFIDSIGRYFGTPFEDRDVDVHGVVQVLFADPSGSTGTFSLEPGDYHVVVSHGPEYDVFDQTVTVSAGATTAISAVVNRVVDTSGFVSMDTHVHMIDSSDSFLSREGRVITMLAEGVDFFVPSDHDNVHDMSAAVTAVGASSLISTSVSDEITTFVYGHYNVWPLTVDPSSPIGGAFDWGKAGDVPGFGYPENGSYDLPPAGIFGAFNPSTQVIQINHVNSGTLGFFNNLGIDTEAVPPSSSDLVYACVGGSRDTRACEPEVCIAGVNDGLACANDADCPGGACHQQPIGRDCPGGNCEDMAANLSALIRLDPAISNLYDNNYTSLEVWIEDSRSQTELMRHDNLGDWAGLLNQGIFKTGVADSDTHQATVVQAGSPRTFVAYPTDDPGLIDASTLALNVNAGRAVGSGYLFMRVSLSGDGGAVASHALGDPLTVAATGGTGSVDIHVESPTWAEFDTVEVYMNETPDCQTGFTFHGVADRRCDLNPTTTLHKDADFTVNTQPGVSGFGSRLVADISVPVVVTEDSWVIVVARGSDGVSKPLFPINPVDLSPDAPGNDTLAGITDGGASPPWNLGELGVLATAFSNPLFFDFENDGFCHGGSTCP
ncbi:MAG: hypothetical protein ACE5E4_05190 [Candidatus Binatia bacterium]